MNNLKYNYAIDKFKCCVGINEAIKGNKYFLGYSETELIVREGEINKKHFSLKSGNNEIIGSGGGESPEHYNTKFGILKDGYFDFKDVRIVAKRIEVEGYFKEIGKQCDVVFYDENDNLMCIIEVYVTNRKTKEDIIKLNKLNVPVYEYNYNNGETELICWSLSSEEIRKKFEQQIKKWYADEFNKYAEGIERDKRKFERLALSEDLEGFKIQERDVENQTADIEREEAIIEGESREYVEKRREIESLEVGVERNNRNIGGYASEKESMGNDVKWTEKRIKEVAEDTRKQSNLNEEVQRLESKVKRVDGDISWQNNRSKQFKTIIARGH